MRDEENIEGGRVRPVSSLLDGAAGNTAAVLAHLEERRSVVADPEQGLAERLEAFEDIIDSEVGDTGLVRARNIERETGIRQIYLKFEGGNPTGTQKDRIAFAQVLDAVRRGFDAITVASCGNYGAAMALAASVADLRCVVYIPETYQARRTREVQDLGAEVVRAGRDYEQAVEASRELAEGEECYDANPGGTNSLVQLKAYGEIAWEIYDELRDAPAAVAVPVSNGTTLAGIYRGFLSLYRRGRTSRMPRLVVGSSFRKNPIVHSFLSGLSECADLDPERVRETAVNEPLVNWHSIDGQMALQAIRDSRGWAANASDRMMSQTARLVVEKEGLHVLPASTAGLVSLLSRHAEQALENDRYVAVLTGRKA